MSKRLLVTLLALVTIVAGSSVFLHRNAPLPAPTLIASTTLSTDAGHADSTTPIGDMRSMPSTESVRMRAGDAAYVIRFAPDMSVLDAMQAAKAGGFSFIGRDYPGMGFFVDTINGKKNADGMYWILYINGTSTATGVSSTDLKPGDEIEWRYKKSY